MKQVTQTIGCFSIACIVGFSAQRLIQHVEGRFSSVESERELRIDSSKNNVEEKVFAASAGSNSSKQDQFDGYQSSYRWEIHKPKVRTDEIPRQAYLIRGWSLFHVGEYEDASRVFEKLYKTQADSESAQGIVASLRAGGDMARLERLATEWGGALATETSQIGNHSN